jgi:hypothetical protein
MTLVLNRQLLSNGSKFLFFSILVISFSACGGSKKVTSNGGLSTVTTHSTKPVETKPTDPIVVKSKENYEPIKRDTIVWYDTINTGSERIVICNKEHNGFRFAKDTIERIVLKKEMNKRPKDSYNMVIMLPFMTNLFDPSGGGVKEQSRVAVDFYEGVKMAIQDLRSEGLNLNIRVVDENAGGYIIDSLLNTDEVLNADIIFGPVIHASANKVSEFCLKEGKLNISPLNPKELTNPNENFLQFNPTNKGHAESLLRHVMNRFRSKANVIIVSRDEPNELEVVRYLESIYPLYDRMGNSVHTYTVAEGAVFSCETFNQYTTSSDSNVVIFPCWANETFVSETLKAIRSCGKKVYVFGMPKWADFKKSYGSFSGLNLCISDETAVDVTNDEIKKFRRRYFDNFRSVPGEYGYKGYDIMLYLGRMLKRNGLGLVDKVGDSEQTFYHTSFEFKPTYHIKGNNKTIMYLENKAINIKRFTDGRFVKIY